MLFRSSLFKAGIDPKKKYSDGANLLLLAIANDKELLLTQYLETKGLSLKDVDNNGNTAINYVARSGNIPLIKTLLAKGIKYTDNALLLAAQGSRRESNNLETYKYLVEDLKIKPTVTNKEGQTVLHFLANKANQTEIINYFLAKGVDPNKVDTDGNTPLMIAASARDIATLQLLLPLVKDINIQNLKGESALTVAVKSGTPEAVTLLLNKNADVKVLDKEGNNLGFYVVQSYRSPMGGMGQNTPSSGTNEQDPFDIKVKLLQNRGLNLDRKSTRLNSSHWE